MSALTLFLFFAIHGVVKDSSGQPLGGASVSLDNSSAAVVTPADGSFVLDAGDGKHTVRVSRSGFQSDAREVRDGDAVEFDLRPTLAETIVVSGIRADEPTPVTKSNIERAGIERDYHQQDIPLLMTETPSINAYTESGIGSSGYAYITLRGVSPTRINFTLDGVPLADSEDMATYFADFPDLARSLESIQIQRGVGTSTVGTASFGGSVNLESIDLAAKNSTDARLATGAYGQRFATIGYQSGTTPGGFALYSRLSVNHTDGFREHSGVDQHNLFVSAEKLFGDAQLKLTGFTAHERQHMSFNASDEETLRKNLRDNPLGPNDRDSFGYDLANLQYIRALTPSTNMTASAYYQAGYGWYSLSGDRYALDGRLVGSMLTMSWTRGAMSASYGLHANHFNRTHTLDLADGPRAYSNFGTKDEINAFAKMSVDRAKWHLYGDAQLRTTDFHYHGDVHIDPIRWTFFNPKAGARCQLAPSSSLYASLGVTTREPARNDLFQGEDNASFAHDLHAVKPERLFDIEAGWDWRVRNVALTANVYSMNFRHEIAATGELSDIGLPLRKNVNRSYRRGIELDAQWQATSALHFRTAANVSRNRIAEWTQFFDVYDAAGNIVGSKPLVFHDVNPILTPALLVSETVDYARGKWNAGVAARHAAKSYLDNTNNDAFTTPSFTTVDATLGYALSHLARVSLVVNNVTDNRRVFPSGYSYQFMDQAGNISGIRYFYPQATRNAAIMIDLKQ
jgi:iron complex outermembrane recepter protein